ncbi:MAG: DUF2203 domain-containing protein [bacterium]|nr:DUF2203 domain-containing protein [bacterium]
MPGMKGRTFTPAEANKTLPLVRRIVADILEKGDLLRRLGARGDVPGVRAEFEATETELRGLLTEMESIGCYYKDWGFEMGLVDFPGTIGGEEVLLCWRSDEENVTWYHTPDGGFAGRQPIPDELL